MEKIQIIAQLVVKADKRSEFPEILKELRTASRQEEGNCGFDIYENIENPLVFSFVECWSSAKAIKEHNNSPHFKKFLEFIEGRIDKLTISQLRDLI